MNSFQVHNWKKSSSDFFYFRPATQEKELITSENDIVLCEDEVIDDDILYSQPTMYEGNQAHTLCFIHQSVEQLAILKRYMALREQLNLKYISF